MNLTFSRIIELLIEKIEGWIVNVTTLLPNLVVAILIVILFWYLAQATKSLINNLLNRVINNPPVTRLVAGLMQIIVATAGMFISLGILHLDKTVTSLLAGAGVIGLAIGFAFQEIASNFISGIFITLKKPFKIGDIVKVNDHEGMISDINLRVTTINTYDGLEVIVPNKDMFTLSVINFTSTPERRVDVNVGVSYSEDLEDVRRVVLESIKNIPGLSPNKAPEVFFTEFADSSVNFSARIWVNKSDPTTFNVAKNQMIINIYSAFKKEGITIPFPMRTIEIINKN